MKLVINSCYGGFGLSDEAEEAYAKRKGFEIFRYVQTRYKHEGGEIYERATQNKRRPLGLSYTFKEDHGDRFTEFPKDGSYWYSLEIERNDPDLVSVVEELGERSNSEFSKLKVIEIPYDIDYVIEEYDGIEWVTDAARRWE